jgi:hypothetical protein
MPDVWHRERDTIRSCGSVLLPLLRSGHSLT